MPLPSPKTVAELQEFAESSEGLGNPGQNAWQSFWSQVETVVQPHLGHSVPTHQDDNTAARAVGKALLRYLDSRGSVKTALAPGAVTVLEWLAEFSLQAEHAIRDIAGKVLDTFCASESEGCELFYGGLLMNSILRVLDPKATHADVARLYKQRHYLPALDWEDESIEDLRTRLLHLAMNGVVLRAPEAAGLIAFFFTLHPSFTMDLHATVKNHLPVCRQTMVAIYATAYFKAWKASTGGTRVQVETAIQEWIFWAVMAEPLKAAKARCLLADFHNHREPAVEDMLVRLYEPILWRNLKVANWKVRFNATCLLSAAFPIVEMSLGVAEHEEAMQRHYSAFLSLLNDPHDEIRKVAVAGVCKVLNQFWELVPAGIAAQLLGELIERCAKDKNSAHVRAAVPEGFATVLKNPLSHAALATILPPLAPLLDDKHPMVRYQFAKLLKQVSLSKQITTFAIASQHELLARLAREHELAKTDPKTHGPVAQQLVGIMADSLFTKEIKEQVKRCCWLASKFPAAFLPLLEHCKIGELDRVRLAVGLFSTSVEKLGKASQGAATPEAAVATEAWAVEAPVANMLLRGTRTLLKDGRGGKSSAELQKFIHQHISDENVVRFFAPEYKMRAALAVCVAECDPAKMPKVSDFVRTELQRLWETQALLGHVQDPEVWALFHMAKTWNIIEPLEQRVLGNMDELSAILLEQEEAVSKGKSAPAPDAKRIRDLKQSVEVLTELFKRPNMHPPEEVRKKVVQLSDGVSSLALAAAKRANTALAPPADLSTPSDVLLLGYPGFLLEMLPDLLGVLGRAALQGEDAGSSLGSLADVFTTADVTGVCERLRTCGSGGSGEKKKESKNKKAKLAWAPWHTEAAMAVRVLERMVQQVIVATLAGQLGLVPKLPAVCEQMVAWGQVADWLVLLTGEEAGSAGAGAWQCAASAVKQLVHAKAPVCHVCDLAEVVFKHANAENSHPLALFLLKRFEHTTELKGLLTKREQWPATVAHAVSEAAAAFPGVSSVLNPAEAEAEGEDEPMTPVRGPEQMGAAVSPIHA